MLKNLVNIALVGTSNIINSVLALIFLVAVAKALPLENFGKYSILAALMLFLARSLDLGAGNRLVSELGSSPTSLHANFINSYFSSRIIVFCSFLILSPVLLFMGGIHEGSLILIFVLGYLGYSGIYTLQSLMQANHDFIGIAGVNSVPALIKFCCALAYFMGFLHLTEYLALTIFSLASFSAVIFVKRLAKPSLKDYTFNFSLHLGLTYLKKSFYSGISVITREGWPFVTNYSSKLVFGFSEAGLISLGDKVATFFSMISSSVFSVLLPVNSQRKGKNKAYDFFSFFLVASALIIGAFVASIIGPWGISLIFGDKFSKIIPVFPFLIFANAFLAIQHIFENFLYVENKTKNLALSAVLKIAVFVITVVICKNTLQTSTIAVSGLIASVTSLVFMLISYRF